MAVEASSEPVWLTKNWLEQKLRLYFKNESLELDKLEIRPAVPKGENYASVMNRIKVEFSTKDSAKKNTITFLAKSTFSDKDPASDLLSDYGIYTREMDMYEKILPYLAELVQKELGDSKKLFAGTVSVDREKNCIIFEDLSLEQYKVVSRLDKLDLKHTHLLLDRLATFHAAAAVLAERRPGIFERNYDRGFFNKHTRGYETTMKNLLQALSRSLELNPDLKQRYQAKINHLIDHVMDYGEKSTSVNPNDFVTLCHGDLWTTNVMFQYDEQGHPNNVILIDFQFSVWNSPAIDLHYLFSTAIQENLRWNRQPELVQFYYYKLKDYLTMLNYSAHIPSLFDFQKQFQNRAFYGL